LGEGAKRKGGKKPRERPYQRDTKARGQGATGDRVLFPQKKRLAHKGSMTKGKQGNQKRVKNLQRKEIGLERAKNKQGGKSKEETGLDRVEGQKEGKT